MSKVLVLDSGGLSSLAKATPRTAAVIAAFRRAGLWPPLVPSVVLTESTTGRPRDDANLNRFLKTCDVTEGLREAMARRAGELRYRAGRGSVVDAIVVASAEPGGTVLTGDEGDLRALASHTDGVSVQGV